MIDIKQNIYDGGITKNKKAINKLQTKIDIYNNDIELRQLIEQINYLYFLIVRKSIDVLETVNTTLSAREKLVNSAVKNGILQSNDLDILRIEILRNHQNQNELKHTLAWLYNTFTEYTRIRVMDSTILTIPFVEIPDSVNINKLKFKIIENQKELLKYNQNLLRAKRKPFIYAYIQGGYGRPALNMLSTKFEPFYIAGISIKWNLWDWNTYKYNKQQIQIQDEMINLRKITIDQKMKTDAHKIMLKINQLYEALQIDSTIVKLRTDITERTAKKIDKGIITTADYINDLIAEIQARIQLETRYIQLMQEKILYRFIIGIDEESLFLKKSELSYN